nr:FAD-dependent oxidoreductase [Sphingomonas sp. CDS-1]
MSADVVVIGCGVAGLSAAVAAAEGGAKVVLLERSTEDERGGNSRYTSAWMRMKSETEVCDDLSDLLLERGHGAIPPEFLKDAALDYENWPQNLRAFPFNDPEVVMSLVENAPPTVAWLKQHGIKFTFYEPQMLETGSIRMGPSGGGLALIEALGTSALGLGVEFRYETTARDLLKNDDGTIRGVQCWSREKGDHQIEGKAVIVASGGFQGNVEMMTRYQGQNALFARPVSRGGLYNKGEGIEMMLAAGAAAAGQYDMSHSAPIDPRSTQAEAIVGVVNFGLLVDVAGKRFVDEGTNRYELFYDEAAWTIMRQREGMAWLIVDEEVLQIPNVHTRIQTDVEPMRATSAEELAAKIGVPVQALTETIASYNAATSPDGPYDVMELDGRSTKDLVPPKSNWARPIDAGRLCAYPVISGTTFTAGGVKVTKNAEVVNRDGSPIAGLYAAGETMGLYYKLYVGATSVLRGLVFGRLAGLAAASRKDTQQFAA